MAVESADDLVTGQIIRFKSINPHDNVRWYGIISGICDYNIARQFQDVDTYYQDVKRSTSNIVAKEEAKYIILKVPENDGSTYTIRVFATDWIDASTLETVEENTHVTIRVYDIDSSKAIDILTTITAMGYTAEIVSED